jgi:RNA-directed DNA polymerase
VGRVMSFENLVDPEHAGKHHAQEPGELRFDCRFSRPAREGEKPKCGRAQSEGVGLRRSTDEPAERGSASNQGGGEGRAATKENIVRSSTPPAQNGRGASQRLSGLRRQSYYAPKRKAAPGVDGVRWGEYQEGLEDRLKDLHSRIHLGTYGAQPARRVYIEKADGRQRPLGIASLEDKIVQHGLATILNEIYEVDFKGFSYGVRQGREPHQALDALNVAEREGCEADHR